MISFNNNSGPFTFMNDCKTLEKTKQLLPSSEWRAHSMNPEGHTCAQLQLKWFERQNELMESTLLAKAGFVLQIT